MPTATDFKDYYATLGVPKQQLLKKSNELIGRLPVSAIPTSIQAIKPPRQSSKISMKQIRYFPTQKSGRNMTSLVSTGIALVTLKRSHLAELMSRLKILVSMVILTRLSTTYWVVDVELPLIAIQVALKILGVDIVLKLPHQILKPRSH